MVGIKTLEQGGQFQALVLVIIRLKNFLKLKSVIIIKEGRGHFWLYPISIAKIDSFWSNRL